jgi:tetratricopeptide (TPR) repeat protein
VSHLRPAAIGAAAATGTFAAVAAGWSTITEIGVKQLAWALVASVVTGVFTYWQVKERQSHASASDKHSLTTVGPTAFAESPTSIERDLFQLPPDIADFTGREDESARVRESLEDTSATATTVVVIAGKGGIGKTTLAIHEAQRLRRRFRDGQLYVNLRGAEAQRLDPIVVLGEFLIVLGLERSALPESHEGRARLFRARLDSKNVLVVLDNAFDEKQVRPLLPGSPNSAVLITSRSRLDGLAGSHIVELDVLESRQAISLLAKIAGPERVNREPAAAEAVIELCGRLPLAVRIAGAKLKGRPEWPVASLVQRLRSEKNRLSELKAGDLEVRSCFAVGYTGLDEQTKRAFRLLGVLNLPDFPSWIAGPLFGTSTKDGNGALERLVNAQLVERSIEDALGQDRYRLHDLLRLFAREGLAEEDTEVAPTALQRVLEIFLTFAEFANAVLGPADILKYLPPRSKRQRIEDDETKELIRRDPLGWLGIERLNYIVAIEQAHETGHWELTWRLAIALAHFFDTQCHWSDWEHTHELALKATRELGDRSAEAYVLDGLGITLGYQNRFEETNQHKKQALSILQELGDQYGEAYVLRGLGMAYFNQNRFAEALEYLLPSLSLFERLEGQEGPGDLMRSYVNGRAYDLHSLGLVYENQGRFDEAANALEQGRELFYRLRRSGAALRKDQPAADSRTQLGADEGLGLVLSDLGELYRVRPWLEGASEKTVSYLEEALSIFRRLGNTFREARALQGLGRLYCDQGAWDQALNKMQESLLLFQAVGSRRGQADAWRGLGEVYHAVGNLENARDAFDESLKVDHETEDRLGEARTLKSLGALLESSGDADGAASAWHTALQVFEAVGTPEATQVRALIAEHQKKE